MSGSSSSNGPRRPSRWGGANKSSSSSTSDSNSASASAPAHAIAVLPPALSSAPPMPNVSDQDALQALLSEVRAKEQVQAKQKAAAQSKDHHSNQRRKRPDEGRDRSNTKQPKHGDNDNKDSYYGPERGEAGDDDEKEMNVDAPAAEGPPSAKPNFGLSGALAKDVSRSGTAGGSRMYKGVLLKFQEPPEARAPVTQWRLYVYKNDKLEQTLHISKQSAYLIGRSPEICDIVTAHPSCSTQHAVLQYRALPVQKKNEDGGTATVLHCQPYLLDLESTNGTFLNGVRLDAARYYQCKTKDVLRFGASTREYVLLC